jgi:ketosteroid isomerase-like protein
MFAVRIAAAAVVLTAVGISTAAQTPSADERAIRDLITRYDRGESVARIADDILWTPDFSRPVIGRQRGGFLVSVDPFTPDQVAAARAAAAASPRVPGSRRRVTTPVRIEIAQSGDLAYEFSNSDLSFDLKTGGRDVTTSSVLRVWKKEEGQWKIAALFARPHDVDAAAATVR